MSEISVIITAYNAEKYIKECIISVISQTFVDYEVIVINDGSTDYTEQIIHDFLSNDKRIFYHYQENQGVAAARNLGLKKAQGKYIVFVDSDDIVDTDYLKILYDNLVMYNADISICGNKRFTDFIELESFQENTETILIEMNSTEALSNLIDDDWLKNYSWDKLIKKELFNGISFPENRKNEDTPVIYQIISKAQKIIYTTKELYFYRINNNSLTGKADLRFEYDFLLALIERNNYLKSINNMELIEKNEDSILNLSIKTVTKYKLSPLTKNEKKYLQEFSYLLKKINFTKNCYNIINESNYNIYKLYKKIPFVFYIFLYCKKIKSFIKQ